MSASLYDSIKKEKKSKKKYDKSKKIDDNVVKHNCKLISKEEIKNYFDFNFAEAMIYASAFYSFSRFKNSIDPINDIYNLMIEVDNIKIPVYIDSNDNVYIFIESKLIMDLKVIDMLRIKVPKKIHEMYKDKINKIYTIENFNRKYYKMEWEY